MLLFFSWSPGMGLRAGRAGYSPLLFLLPLLLDPSAIQLLWALLQWALGIPSAATTGQNYSQPRSRSSSHGSRQQQVHATDAGTEFVVSLLRGFILTFVGYAAYRVYRWVKRSGSLRAAWQRLQQDVRQQADAGRRTATGRRSGTQARATVEQVAAALQQLPTELHATEEELSAMSVHELKERLGARHVDCSQFLEKTELLGRLTQCGGSTATSCSICCEDFESGDPVRILPCQHRYHIDCVDKWLLSSTDYSRPPACPMCNAELLPGVQQYKQQQQQQQQHGAVRA